MSFSFVQSNGHQQADAPFDLPFDGGNVGAGHLLTAFAYWNSATFTPTVSDSLNGTWTAVGTPKVGTAGQDLAAYSIQMFYVLSAAAGATTATLTLSTTAACALAIHEYSFTGGAATVDGTPVYTAHDNTATPTTGAVVTTANGDLLFSAILCGTGVSSAGTGYVLRESADIGTNGTEDDLDGGTAGSKTASFNVSSTDNILGLIAFKDTGATTSDVNVTDTYHLPNHMIVR